MKKNVTTKRRLEEEFFRAKPEFYNLKSNRTVGSREVEMIGEDQLQGLIQSLANPIRAEWEIVYD